MNFIKVKETMYRNDKVYINLNHITYIHIRSRTIRLSDGLELHLTDESMNKVLEYTIGVN